MNIRFVTELKAQRRESKVIVQFPVPWLSNRNFCVRMVCRSLRNRTSSVPILSLSVWISRGAGLALSVNGAMILLHICRNILSLDESQWFHRQITYLLLL
ncbi:hypothetical protein B0O99DRAFT_640156 [Bisporella sp. PMI_857]|nr:hypothetical protein B0O99DRAFT_640156 [Bisporella sp. PMI_857]